MSGKGRKGKSKAGTQIIVQPERSPDRDKDLLLRLAGGARWLYACRSAGYHPDDVELWMGQDFVFARAVAGARAEGREIWVQRMGERALHGVRTEKREYAVSELTGEEVLVKRVEEISDSVKAIEMMAKIDNPELFAKRVEVVTPELNLTEEQKMIGLRVAMEMGLIKTIEAEEA